MLEQVSHFVQYNHLKLIVWCLLLALSGANAQIKLLPLSRYEEDSGGWFSGAMGYQTNGAELTKRFSEQLHWEYRTKEAFGVLVGMHFWKTRVLGVAGERDDKYENWISLDAGMKFRFPLEEITPHIGFGTKLVASLAIGALFYYSVGFELPILRWLHPTCWVVRTTSTQDSFFVFTGVANKL